jgi:glutathione S-transferase
VIVLRAKKVDFEVTYIDLRDKPDWFLEISPHGKVPVLVVDGDPLFESNAIAEYLDEVVEPRLHPEDPKKRARNRAWTDFVPDFSKALSAITYAKSKEKMEEAVEAAPKRLERVENAIATERGNDGPYFNGTDICLVDASYAPFLQRFAIMEDLLRTGLLKDYPLIQAWSDALLADDIVTGSVAPEFLDAMAAGLKRREAYAAPLMESKLAAE